MKQQNRGSPAISALNPLSEKLLPFQRTGVEFVLSLNGRALIADDMGLGKTIQVNVKQLMDLNKILFECKSNV